MYKYQMIRSYIRLLLFTTLGTVCHHNQTNSLTASFNLTILNYLTKHTNLIAKELCRKGPVVLAPWQIMERAVDNFLFLSINGDTFCYGFATATIGQDKALWIRAERNRQLQSITQTQE